MRKRQKLQELNYEKKYLRFEPKLLLQYGGIILVKCYRLQNFFHRWQRTRFSAAVGFVLQSIEADLIRLDELPLRVQNNMARSSSLKILIKLARTVT